MNFRFNENGILLLDGIIRGGDSNNLRKTLKNFCYKKSLSMMMTSPGGSIHEASEINSCLLNIVSESGFPTICIAHKFVSSAAIIPFICCNQRYVYDLNTTFLFHNPEFNENVTKEEVYKQTNNVHRLISEETKMSINEVKSLMDNKVRLSAKDAVNLGVIHNIIKKPMLST